MGYKEDYAKAKADGTLLDPMPDGFVNVRTIARDLGIKVTVFLETGEVKAQGLHDAGVRGVYDRNFETFVSASDAVKLRKWVEQK